MTVDDLLKNAVRNLGVSDHAHLDAEILLAFVMQVERTYLYAHPEAVVDDDKVTTFQKLVSRRSAGYPIAYLTRTREFWSLNLMVSEATLIPRPETEYLVKTALEIIPEGMPYSVLELGTGSGAIAVAVAGERPLCRITSTDISDAALSVAKRNGEIHQRDNITFLKSDWYRQLDPCAFNLIISNPPYIRPNDDHLSRGDIQFEPRLALVSKMGGLQAIKRILDKACAFLMEGGAVILEHGATQATSVRRLFKQNDFKRITTHHDLARLDRITYGYL